MRVKAVATLNKKMDAIVIRVNTYSSADTMKETLEDNLKKTNALKEFLDIDTPHDKDITVSFGRPYKKRVAVTSKVKEGLGRFNEQTEYKYEGYEMSSSIKVELPLSKRYKYDRIYSESLKYDDCTISIDYTISKELRKQIEKELRQMLIDEADTQMRDLTNLQFEMTDFAYHCELPEYHSKSRNNMFLSDECASLSKAMDAYAGAAEDNGISEEYAMMINSLYNEEMAPTLEFSDEIIVEYVCIENK